MTEGLQDCLDRLVEAEFQLRELNDAARQRALSADGPHGEEMGAALDRRARVLASSIVHQLRSTLDNLVAVLVVANGSAVTRGNAFPVECIDDSTGRSRFTARLHGTSEAVLAAIEECQPWNWIEPRRHPLARLHRLWNQDKHRLLHTVEHSDAEHRSSITLREPVAGLRMSYEDGTPVVGFLRFSLAFVEGIVRGVAPVLEGRPHTLLLDPNVVKAEAEAIRLRDPAGTYMDHLDRLSMLDRWAWDDDVPDSELREILAEIQLLKRDPHHRLYLGRPLEQLEIYVSRRLCGLEDRE